MGSGRHTHWAHNSLIADRRIISAFQNYPYWLFENIRKTPPARMGGVFSYAVRYFCKKRREAVMKLYSGDFFSETGEYQQDFVFWNGKSEGDEGIFIFVDTEEDWRKAYYKNRNVIHRKMRSSCGYIQNGHYLEVFWGVRRWWIYCGVTVNRVNIQNMRIWA